ncbi:hypothetical protein LCGC14_2607320, partial [marine sediment metagenome]
MTHWDRNARGEIVAKKTGGPEYRGGSPPPSHELV